MTKPEEADSVNRITRLMTDVRLLTTGEEAERYVDVAHEALIRNWPRLRQWLDEDRAGLLLHHRISEVAQDWQRSNKEEGMLYRGARLTQAQEWRERNEGELNLLEQEFLNASIAERQKLEQQQRQGQRLLVGAAILFAVLFIVASGAAIFGFWQKGEAVRQRIEAKNEADRAVKAELTANEQKIEADKQKQDALAEKRNAVSANVNLEAKNRELGSMLEEASRSDRFVAEEKLAWGEDGEALAYLARASRYTPRSLFPAEAAITAVLSAPTAHSQSTFQGHKGSVNSAVFSPDARRVLTASYDNTARLWEAESGKLLAIFQGHTNRVVSAVFSPDGRRVLTASWDNTARLWEAESGKLLAIFRGHIGWVVSAVFSRDGRRVLTASWDTTARLWPVLPSGVPPPDWCSDFLVWLGGKRIAPDGQIETFSGDELLKLEARLRLHMNEDTDYARLLRWRLLTPQERPVDPYDATTQEQAADLIIRPGMNSAEAWHAYDLDPWHPLAHLALAGFEEDLIRADFLRRYSLHRLPNDAKLRQRAAEFLRTQGKEDLAREVEVQGKE